MLQFSDLGNGYVLARLGQSMMVVPNFCFSESWVETLEANFFSPINDLFRLRPGESVADVLLWLDPDLAAEWRQAERARRIKRQGLIRAEAARRSLVQAVLA